MKNRCGCIIFAFQGRLKSGYIVLHTHTHAHAQREQESESERESERERGARARTMQSFNEHVHSFSTSTYIHSALPHQDTTHLLSIPGDVEERLHGPALSHTHAQAERGREREREAGRKRERERERERERSGSTSLHSFSTLAPAHNTHPHTHTHQAFCESHGRIAMSKHLCCAGALQGRRREGAREGARARENRGRLHHSDGKILSLATQKTLIPEFCGLGPPLDPRVPSGPANLFPSVLRDSIGCSESRGSRRMQRGAPFAVGQSTAQRNTKCVVHTQWSTRTTTRQRVAQ